MLIIVNFSFLELSILCHKTNDSIFLSVDCEWSEWTAGECSKTCGDGLRINQRFKVTEAMYGGAPCQGEIEMTEDCLDRICPGKLRI